MADSPICRQINLTGFGEKTCDVLVLISQSVKALQLESARL